MASDSQSLVIPDVAPSGTAVMRSLGSRGINTIAVGETPSRPGFRSRYCNERVLSPSPTQTIEGYKETLLRLAKRPDVDALLPARDQDAYTLARYREELGDHVRPLWPDLEILSRAQDRYRLVELASEAGIRTPKTELVDSVDDWATQEWIIKPRFSVVGDAYVDSASGTCFEPPSTRYLPSGQVPVLDAITEEMRHIPIAQEFIPTTDEYVFDALYDHGDCLATFQHRQIRAVEYHGGASAYRESIYRSDLQELGTRLLDHLDWHGVACVEFMEDARTGELVLTEINPRLWSSLPLTIRAGADFPWYYWLAANGREQEITSTYTTGVSSHYIVGELSYLHSIYRDKHPLVHRPRLSRAIWDVSRSFVTDPQFDYFTLRDPGPFFQQAFNVFRGNVTV